MDALTAFGPSGARPGFRIPSDLLGIDTPAFQPIRVGASRKPLTGSIPYAPSKLGQISENEPPKETQAQSMAPISSYDPFVSYITPRSHAKLTCRHKSVSWTRVKGMIGQRLGSYWRGTKARFERRIQNPPPEAKDNH